MENQKHFDLGFLSMFCYIIIYNITTGTFTFNSLETDILTSEKIINELDTIPTKQDSTKVEVPYRWGQLEFDSTKYTPRMIKAGNQIFYNLNNRYINDGRSAYGLLYSSSEGQLKYLTYLYKFEGRNKSRHFIFDVYKNKWVYHKWNFITYINEYGGPIKSVDSLSTSQILIDPAKIFLIEKNLKKVSNRSGYLTKVFQNRQNKYAQPGKFLTYTKDSIIATNLLYDCWYDFHIDKKGKTHAFVYIRGELIYLQQKKASHKSNVNTWKEIFSIPATDEIGPFTSVTFKGKQYLFTQNGTILKNNGKTMVEVGKLPGDLRNTSVVWDKEKDKMWYITKEEFEAYKAGDAEILSQLNKIQLTRKSPKSIK